MQIRQFTQISDSHCGPAVLQMLLDAQGVQVTQDQIVDAAGIGNRIVEHGARVDQLALACSQVAPHLSFWYKYLADIDDIRVVLNRGFAVAVEWQGIFYQTLKQQEAHDNDDTGHYSIVSHIDDSQQALIIVDPYKDFVNQDRILPIRDFVKRWWDSNEIIDPIYNQRRIVNDDQLFFFVTPNTIDFAPEFGFKRFNSVEELHSHNPAIY